MRVCGSLARSLRGPCSLRSLARMASPCSLRSLARMARCEVPRSRRAQSPRFLKPNKDFAPLKPPYECVLMLI